MVIAKITFILTDKGALANAHFASQFSAPSMTKPEQ